jgi:S-adenosylmethionine hydrolase
MSIITLTSDFGTKDFSISAVKGNLLEQIDRPTIVDISHEIKPYNIIEASFIVKAAYPNFPKNSIHLIGVDSAYSSVNKHLIAQLDDQYFIGADNGFFSILASQEKYLQLIEIKHPKSELSNFPMLDVFVDIAAQIVLGEKLENLGMPVNQLNKWKQNQPNIAKENEIIGYIVYIDAYGNLITDITKKQFDSFCKKCKFEINVSNTKIRKIYPTYRAFINDNADKEEGTRVGLELAIFNSLDLLEIALYKSNPNFGGSAASLLGLKVGDSISVMRY